MIAFHLMVVPPLESSAAGGHHWLWSTLVWMLPFLFVYLWHLWHDHRHNHVLEKRLREIVERLDRILESTRKEPRP
ncbi:hypothetical protein HY522_08740 [bacterium]|nr:hypothetical protein [bacterium]